MSHRISLAVAASLGAHLLAGVAVVGSSLWRGWPAASVDVEITGMRLEDLQELPLGAPAPGAGRSDAVVTPVPRTPEASKVEKERNRAAPRAETRPERERGPRPVESDPDGGAAPPRPTSVRSYAPQGSRVTALMRVDRLRGTIYAPAVDALLVNLPDRRDLLEGTEVDLYRDIDAILIATPNPLDPRVTFLAARHRLSDAEMRAALERGARATNRKLTWRTERGRPFAERRLSSSSSAGAAEPDPPGKRDHRLILLAAPHLIVVTPPAYRSLILRGTGAASPTGRRSGQSQGGHRGSDAGSPAVSDAGPDPRDGGAGDALAAEDPLREADDQTSWAALLRRIDAEDSIMPADAVAMVSAADLFSARSLRRSLDVVPGTRGTVDDAPPATATGGATIMGLPVPRLLTATLGVTPQPFADIDAEFADAADAARWHEEWPGLRQKLLRNPLVVLSGFSALIGRATLERTGGSVRVHVQATELETTRILQLIAMQISAMRP